MARRWWRKHDPDEAWRRGPDEPAAVQPTVGEPAPSPGPGSGRDLGAEGDEQWRPGYVRQEEQARPGPYRDTPEAELLPPVRQPVLEADGLVRTYPGRKGVAALKGVSIAVAPGEFLALMGPSGSGKSTLLGLLAGLDRPEQGHVLWKGKRMDRLSSEEDLQLRRKELGMVFQSFGLLPTLSAVENVELPMRVAGARLDRARQAAVQWLARLGLEDRLDNRTFELSAGQQQRVAVARALVIEPTVLLADEPIAEVDTENAELILDALADVVRRGGCVIAATHNPAALAYSGRVVLLRDGRVEATGSPEEMTARLSTD